MSYRDDLEASQEKVRRLEQEIRELKGDVPAPRTDGPSDPDASLPSAKKKSGNLGCLGIPIGLFVIVGACVVGSPILARGCGSMSGETEEPLQRLRACEAAKDALGADVGWANVGCANCESESGGDPVNSGCHSSSSWSLPVSGAKGRGSYTYSYDQPAGKPKRFTGGNVTLSSGGHISIAADGPCRLYEP